MFSRFDHLLTVISFQVSRLNPSVLILSYNLGDTKPYFISHKCPRSQTAQRIRSFSTREKPDFYHSQPMQNTSENKIFR